MPRKSLTPAQLQELRELAAQWGKIIARRACGDEDATLELDFDAMEQIAQAAAAGLHQGTLEILLEQQANALGSSLPCPDCARPCVPRRETRSLAVRGGRLDQSEPVCHCPNCRRDFFPPTGPVTPRRTRL